jgi:hypothetical protein
MMMTVRLCNSNNFCCSALFALVVRLHFRALTTQQVSAVNQTLRTARACSVEHVCVLVLALNSGDNRASTERGRQCTLQ